jgi:hypothetical protein
MLPFVITGKFKVSSMSTFLHCTDKKENQIFLIYKEIQNGAGAKACI